MTELTNTLANLLQNPLTAITAAVGVVGGWLQFPFVDAILGTLWGEAGALFAALSVSATTLAPEVAWLPVETIQVAALVMGVLLVVNRLYRVGVGFQQRLTDSEDE